MSKLFTILIGLVLYCGSVLAQPPDTLWTKTYGGSDDDIGRCVQQTSDGGFIIVGYTESYGFGGRDIYLIKTNANGDTIWTRNFGGIGLDEGYSVQQTTDGGYIISGKIQIMGEDVYLIKTDINGNIIWTQVYGGDYAQSGNCVQQTFDEGFIITGYTGSYGNMSDVYLIKTDTYGDTLWTKTYGGDYSDEGNCVKQTIDEGYIIVGKTAFIGSGISDVYLIKTDVNGNMLWNRTFGGTQTDYGNSIQQTFDEGYIIVGTTNSYGWGDYDIYLIKTNIYGDTLWTKTYGGGNHDFGYSVKQTMNGGYIIAGHTYSYGAGMSDVYLIRTDFNGNIIWTCTYGGNNYEFGYDIYQISVEEYVVVGSTISYGNGEFDVWIVRLGESSGVEFSIFLSMFEDDVLFSAYPNPFNSVTNLIFELPVAGAVSLVVYDIQGREIVILFDDWCSNGVHEATFDASRLTSGIYFARMIAGDFQQTQKLLLVK